MVERKEYIDVASGLMIIWVLINHALFPSLNRSPLFYVPWLVFFMPYFFYKSGAFFLHKPWREELEKDATKLLRKWAIWSAIGYLALVVLTLLMGDASFSTLLKRPIKQLIYEGRVCHNEGLWFLFSLFIVRQVANIGQKTIHHVIILCLALAGAAFMNHYPPMGKYIWIANSLSGLAFFELGLLCHKWDSGRLAIVIATCVYVICTIWQFPLVSMWNNQTLRGGYFLWFPVCICGIVLLFFSSRLISSHLSKFSRVLSHVGRNAMYYYVPHFLLSKIWIVIWWTWLPNIEGKWITIIIMVTYILLLPPLRKLQIRYNI